MKALVLDAERRTGIVKDVPVPESASNEVLIQVRAIALNPVDALYTAHPLGQSGRTLGSDFSGEVVELGLLVPTSSQLQPGSRVAGFLQGACSINDRPGAFAEYLVVPWDLVWRINGLGFEEAATVSLSALTAAQALYLRLSIPAPFSWSQQQRNDEARQDFVSIVINGASTSVALYAAQLARASPKPVTLFGTASAKHTHLLSNAPYEYESLVDYQAADWPHKILQMNNGQGLDFSFDCISERATVLNTARTLRQGGKLAVVRSREGQAWSTSSAELGLEPSYGAVWEGLGEDVVYAGMTLPANAEAREFAVAFYAWLSEGRNIVPNPTRIMPGGLEEVVEDGFLLLGTGSMADRGGDRREEEHMRPVSGEKLVYRIS